MTIEELKQKLASGELTKEQFDAEVKKLLDGGSITQEQHDEAIGGQAGGDGGHGQGNDGGGLTMDQVQKMIQSENDKIRTEYSQKLKDAQTELDKLKTEKMSEEEKAKYEREKFESELKQREKDLMEREVKLHTVDKLREMELPLEFRDILAGSDVEGTDERIKTFQNQWQKALQKAIDEKFKSHGDDPNKGKGSQKSDQNPWSAEHFNLTKQAQILKDDPDLAKQLKAQAGK